MDTSKAVTHISLCAGYGGIDLGLKRAVPSLRTIAFSEIEAFACANLVAKMEAGYLDPAPIWSNLKTFPWDSFRDRVDILSGGYPCQPFSSAGKRLGADDPRHLWPFIADGIARMRPRICFFENVEGHITLGLREVIAELESLGYRATWGIFSAAEVGAPHQRKRVFILAVSRSVGSSAGLSRSLAWQKGKSGVADDGRHQDRWPSRPGEPQHPWEPPRTVAYSSNDAGERRNSVGQVPCGHDGTQGEGESCCGGGSDEAGQRKVSQPLRGSSEPAVGDTEGQRSAARRAEHEGLSGEPCAAESGCAVGDTLQSGPSSERERSGQQDGPWQPSAVGDTQSGQSGQSATRDGRGGVGGTGEVMGDTSSLGPCGGPQDGPGQQPEVPRQGHETMADASLIHGSRWGARVGRGKWSTINAATGDEVILGQTEPAVGGDADGSAGGLDYAKLCVSSDNRTDELRLLGNGVVPATAERAFRVLIKRFIP